MLQSVGRREKDRYKCLCVPWHRHEWMVGRGDDNAELSNNVRQRCCSRAPESSSQYSDYCMLRTRCKGARNRQRQPTGCLGSSIQGYLGVYRFPRALALPPIYPIFPFVSLACSSLLLLGMSLSTVAPPAARRLCIWQIHSSLGLCSSHATEPQHVV